MKHLLTTLAIVVLGFSASDLAEAQDNLGDLFTLRNAQNNWCLTHGDANKTRLETCSGAANQDWFLERHYSPHGHQFRHIRSASHPDRCLGAYWGYDLSPCEPGSSVQQWWFNYNQIHNLHQMLVYPRDRYGDSCLTGGGHITFNFRCNRSDDRPRGGARVDSLQQHWYKTY